MRATEIKTTPELDYIKLTSLLEMLKGSLISSLNLKADNSHRHILKNFDHEVAQYHKHVKEKICGSNGKIINNLGNQKELNDASHFVLDRLDNITTTLKRELEIKITYKIHDEALEQDSHLDLLNSLDLNEFCTALRYMAEFASREEELREIIKIRDNSRWPDSNEVKELIRLAEQSVAIRLLRNAREKGWGKFNRSRLLNPLDPAEFEIALRYMAESEEEEDLIVIIKVKAKPPLQLYSDTVQKLLFVVEEKIFSRLYEKEISVGVYQVACNEGDLAYRFAADVHLVHIYPAFSIIMAPSKLVGRLKECYPTTRISEYISIPPKYPVKSEGNMIKVVQFNRPIDHTLREKIQTVGAEIVQALGGGLMAISSDKSSTDKILKFEEVNDVTDYEPSLTKELAAIKNHALTELVTPLRAASTENVDGSSLGILIAIFFNQEYRDRAAVVLPENGIEVLDQAGNNKLLIDLFEHPNIQQAVQILTAQVGLQSIEEKSIPTPCNNVAVPVVTQGIIPDSLGYNILPSFNLRGTGELIAIADGGLDTGEIDTLHQDLRPQVSQIKSYPIRNTIENQQYVDNIGEDCGAADRRDGHGTHVVGSAIGTGIRATETNQNSIRGIAPEAKLIFQALEQKLRYNDLGRRKYRKQEALGYHGIPDELKDLFSCAYQNGAGAKIHSNSWGDKRNSEASKYTDRCRSIDDFMWEHKDFLIVVAAGNNGSHFRGDIEIALGSICPPGTAKNCLTVGASENYRIPEFQETYGSRHGFDYEPFCNDITTDSIDDIAAFSSRGPCKDGRYKPDVVAPGTFILSTRSSQIANDASCSAPHSNDYMYMCGSSMATPLVAGGVALVRQYLRENTKYTNPSGALLKATVIHSAQYVEYKYRNSTSTRWVDNEQGWGRVTLANSLSPASPTKIEFIDQLDGLLLGEAFEYKVKITNLDVSIRVIMAYTDLPGSRLINNLNIRLTDPNGNYYLGNDFDNKKEHDLINNVEGIIVNPSIAGIWSITVTAYSLPEPEKGNQDFAVVASGGGLEIIETIKYSKQ
jgi:serine protease AprX